MKEFSFSAIIASIGTIATTCLGGWVVGGTLFDSRKKFMERGSGERPLETRVIYERI